MVYVIDCVNLSLTPKRPEINSYKTETGKTRYKNFSRQFVTVGW